MEPHLARNTPTMIRRSTTDTVKHSEYRKVSPAPSQPRRVLSSSLPSPCRHQAFNFVGACRVRVG